MLSITERVAFLKETQLFSDAPVDDLERIAGVAEEVHFANDQTFIREGEKGDALYFVVRGQAKVHKSGVEIVKRGLKECIGEIAIIDEGPRSTSISSIGDVLLLKIGRDSFYRAVQGNQRLLQNTLKIVARKLREDTDREIEAAREHERMMHDMARARELQMNMLPAQDLRVRMVGGSSLEASGRCYPAEMVGGDYYDYFPLPNDRVGLVIGDVMGHGFHTGLMVSTARSCLHTQIKADCSLPSVMSAMNSMAYGFVHGDHHLFMSFCYIIVGLQDHTISFSNAGHTYPCHYHADTKQLDMMESNACVLGILDYQHYEVSGWEWREGDIFVLYSDGITEARSKKGEDFGEGRLKQLIIENAHLSPAELKETILREFNNFCHDVIQSDDVSLVIVKMGA
jgi:sigma-B regulation protein RsbU (phosphoserine phosphatase)